MPVFMLRPSDEGENHPKWLSADLRDICWVNAKDEGQARTAVHFATLEHMATMGLNEIPFTPWVDSHLTICIEDDSRTDVPDDGAVIRSDGSRYP